MKIFLFIILATWALPSLAQRKHYTLTTKISCLKTTEDGEDEVYAIVVWKTSDGRTGSTRIPSAADHYSINDNPGSSQRQFDGIGTSVTFEPVEFDLAPGTTIDIFCAIMEQDDGRRGQYDAVGQKILQLAKSPSRFSGIQAETFKGILAGIANTNNLRNSDDWIGTFTHFLQIKPGGELGTRSSTKMNNSTNGGGTPDAAVIQNNRITYEFTGDGTHYYVSFSVK